MAPATSSARERTAAAHVAAATASPPPEPVTHVIELHRTTRIDSYRATVDGRDWRPRIGWSRVLDGLRRALPRLASPRHYE